MLLPLHITIALLSVFYTIFAFFEPTKKKLNFSYLLLALTLLSGTALVVSRHIPLASVCVSGLSYVIIMLAGIGFLHHKISKQKI